MAFSRSSTATTAGDIYGLIRAAGATTRTEIGEQTGLSRTAVAARVAALADQGQIIEREQAPSTGGRPAAPLTFNADAGVVLAAAIGRRRTRLGLCLPGTVDQQRGCSLDSPIMSGWDGVPLAPNFAELTDAPVILDNDVNVIALAERRGDRQAVDDVLVIKASTGLGAGIIAGGSLQRGAVQAAGAFGNNTTPAADGVPCRCGDTGCLEAIAGGWALVRALQADGRAVGHLRDVVELANSGDPDARRMIRDSGRHIGEVLAAAVNLLNPAVLVVAGDMA